jgi:hypothetical protein
MKQTLLLFGIFFLGIQGMYAQDATITINTTENQKPISPYIYGRNNSFSDNPSNPTLEAAWQKYNDAGVRMYRENGGNNSTKYNWKLRLSSHPDWYNNVYTNNWDFKAQSILQNTQNTQAFFAFQLLGKVAKTDNDNFRDWDYNSSQWWEGVNQNLAGGGQVNTSNTNKNKALVEGNIDLYLKDWSADSTVAIMDYWFNDLGYDKNRFIYWNMDNEPDVWNGTHDDVVKTNMPAEEYLQKYFAVAKAARAKYPNIKLVGPVFTNEWQWYNWNGDKVTGGDGKKYVWTEYFIKRVAEEQIASGVRLLDVLDFHFYAGSQNKPDLTLQLHRIWFDTQWDYADANGVKRTGTGDWDNNISKEYIMQRSRDWLTQYMGANHGVTFGVSEIGAIDENPNVVACWYASHLGTFANEGVELFTPWDWYKGQWEVLHLFSNYFGTTSVKSISSNESLISAYSALDADKDTLTVVLVNRDRNNAKTVKLNIPDFEHSKSNIKSYQLANLSVNETFVSKTNNALQKTTVSIASSLSLPKLSVTLLQIPLGEDVTPIEDNIHDFFAEVFPNPIQDKFTVRLDKFGQYTIKLINPLGKVVNTWKTSQTFDLYLNSYPQGMYMLQIESAKTSVVKKIIKE